VLIALKKLKISSKKMDLDHIYNARATECGRARKMAGI